MYSIRTHTYPIIVKEIELIMTSFLFLFYVIVKEKKIDYISIYVYNP